MQTGNSTLSNSQLVAQKWLELDTLLSSKTEKSLHWSKAKFLLHSNSASSMFACKLIQTIHLPHLYKLRNTSGHMVSYPKSWLCLKISTLTYFPTLSPSWLSSLLLPSLTSPQIESLNAPFTEEELLKVIKSLKQSVAPGPDGFMASYYKHYASVLTPRLTTMFNNTLNGERFPNELTLANMSLLPKPLKDHSLPQNYRPISVINNDPKIFSRALADRLANIIETLKLRSGSS